MKTFNFQPSTWENVITPLRSVLEKKALAGTHYPTLGHFYREIELLKFPWLGNAKPGTYYYSKYGRNVYSQQQYNSIRDYCIDMGWIVVVPNVNRKNAYVVEVTQNVIVECPINLGVRHYPKDLPISAHYVTPIKIIDVEGEKIVMFKDSGKLFQEDHTGLCPLNLEAFLDWFEEKGPVSPAVLPLVDGPRKNSATSDGNERIKHEEELLNRAFGIPDEWVVSTQEFIDECIDDGNKITLASINLIKKARIEELNEETLKNFSDYEMKLFYSGFLLASHIVQQRAMISTARLTTVILSAVNKFSKSGAERIDLDDILRIIQDFHENDEE